MSFQAQRRRRPGIQKDSGMTGRDFANLQERHTTSTFNIRYLWFVSLDLQILKEGKQDGTIVWRLAVGSQSQVVQVFSVAKTLQFCHSMIIKFKNNKNSSLLTYNDNRSGLATTSCEKTLFSSASILRVRHSIRENIEMKMHFGKDIS
jgi:hypothetical protein